MVEHFNKYSSLRIDWFKTCFSDLFLLQMCFLFSMNMPRLVKLAARAFYDDLTSKGDNQPKTGRSDNRGIAVVVLDALTRFGLCYCFCAYLLLKLFFLSPLLKAMQQRAGYDFSFFFFLEKKDKSKQNRIT